MVNLKVSVVVPNDNGERYLANPSRVSVATRTETSRCSWSTMDRATGASM
jgi:hypothetical protein